MTKKIISLVLILLILSISIISFAETTSELNQRKNELQNQINEAEGKIDEIEGQVDETMSEIDKLNAEIIEKEDEIDTINNELNTLNSEISTLESKLNEEQEKYDSQYEALKSRMVAQYKMGNVSYLDVLLNSKSLSEFISRYYIIEKAAEYDTKLLEKIEAQKNEIESAKKELETKKNEVSEKQATLKIEELALKNKKTNKNKIISQLTDEQKKLQEEIEKANAEQDKIDNELKAIALKNSQSSGSGTPTFSGGKFTYKPCNYTRVSSGFGYRGSAATGGVGSSYHRGIDLAAPNGTPIYAAESGTVIKVSNTCSHNYAGKCGCGGGYGNYIMISHGSNLVTVYAHCSSILVSTGQTVTAGQQIGGVGSTGNSTGFHLHFGVILNGTYVNPAPYIGI